MIKFIISEVIRNRWNMNQRNYEINSSNVNELFLNRSKSDLIIKINKSVKHA